MARPADPNARRLLVAAARDEFARCGIRGARIEDITRASGLSKGSFYLHFDSKEALFGEVVAQLSAQLDALVEQRQAATVGFFAENGPLSGRDVQRRSTRYERWVAVETRWDREVLSLLWQFKDVVGVLISGSQGTPFAGLFWELAQREVQRVQRDFEAAKEFGACRSDVPSELLGSMVVGTWLLVAEQMSRLKVRPDLDQWVEALHRLIREGSAPQKPERGKNKVRRRLAA